MSLIDRLYKWKREGDADPYVLDINPTNKCNLECRSCWQRNSKYDDLDYSDELSDDVLINLIEEALELNIARFEITGGGEPLIRKNLVLKIMKKIKEESRFGNITTNGTLLSDDDLDFLVDIGWNSITFSLDGADAETQDYLRGRNGTFDRVVDNLEYLSRMNHDIKIKFNTVISNKNYDQLKRIIELGNQYNIYSINFETMTIHSDYAEELKLSDSDKKNIVERTEKLRNLADKYNIETNIDSFSEIFFDKTNDMDDVMSEIEGKDFSEIACYEPWYHMVVKVDGSVQPCCLFDSSEENVKNSSLRDIWYGDLFTKVRENIKKNNFSKFCKICNASQFIANRELRQQLD